MPPTIRSYGHTAPAKSAGRNSHGITRDTYREISTAVANAINYKRRGRDDLAQQHGRRIIHLLEYHGIV